jgi:hypothetical protein
VRQLKATPQEFDVEVEVRSSHPEHDVTITVREKLSGIHFVDITIPWFDFARSVLTAIHAVDGKAELRVTPDLGKRRENTEVTIDGEGIFGSTRDETTFSNLVRLRFQTEYEALHAAGWRPMYHVTKGFNGNLRTQDGRYRIAIERWVEA